VLALAFWTNFLSPVFWPPVALLLFRRGLRRLIPGLAIATGGFTLGSLPHWVYGLQHGTALPPPGSWIGLAQVFHHLGVAARVSWHGFVSVARASGLAFTRVDVGGLVLFVYAPPAAPPGTPITASGLQVVVSRSRRVAGRAVDGDPRTRWTTARPQAPGDWLRVDFAGPRAVQAVRLWAIKRNEWPRGLQLEASADGETWRPLTAELRGEGAIRWGGITPLRGDLQALRLEFAPTMLRALRLTLTQGHWRYAWSVNELTVHAAD
jgi:hypothetical protein